MRRFSRPCYDKIRRCPGWIGGGPKSRRGPLRCDGGRIIIDYDARWWRLRMWPCDTCNVMIWPYAIQYLSVPQLYYLTTRKIRDAVYLWHHRQ